MYERTQYNTTRTYFEAQRVISISTEFQNMNLNKNTQINNKCTNKYLNNGGNKLIAVMSITLMDENKYSSHDGRKTS